MIQTQLPSKHVHLSQKVVSISNLLTLEKVTPLRYIYDSNEHILDNALLEEYTPIEGNGNNKVILTVLKDMVIDEKSKITAKSGIVINVGGNLTMNNSEIRTEYGDIIINVMGTLTLNVITKIHALNGDIYIKCNKFVDRTAMVAHIKTGDMISRKIDFAEVDKQLCDIGISEKKGLFGNFFMYCVSEFDAPEIRVYSGNIDIVCDGTMNLGQCGKLLAARNNIFIKSNELILEEEFMSLFRYRKHLTLDYNEIQLLKKNLFSF